MASASQPKNHHCDARVDLQTLLLERGTTCSWKNAVTAMTLPTSWQQTGWQGGKQGKQQKHVIKSRGGRQTAFWCVPAFPSLSPRSPCAPKRILPWLSTVSSSLSAFLVLRRHAPNGCRRKNERTRVGPTSPRQSSRSAGKKGRGTGRSPSLANRC